VIKSRKGTWLGHVARTGKRRGAYRAFVFKTEGKRPLGRLRCVDEEIILKWILNNREDGRVWIGLIWLRIGQVVGCCEYAFEHSGSTKYDAFLDKWNA
jgi:hypothetical protein